MLSSGLDQASHCFAFERDFVGNWRCIPLCLRRKLDLAGIKLRLSHWLALDQRQRQELVSWPDDPESLARMASHIRALTRGTEDGEARALPPAVGQPWQNGGDVPADVVASAASLAVDLPQEQWRRLAELERFALCKLARPGHDHHNLPAALTEILPEGAPVSPPDLLPDLGRD
jgi:hypothetical protein